MPFSKPEKLEPFLFNQSDFEELICALFDDLNVVQNFASLPDRFGELREFGGLYFQRLMFLVGDGPNITRDAPIYVSEKRTALYAQTRKLCELIESLVTDRQK